MASEHADHGRETTPGGGPDDPSCPCREEAAACARAGCGFCAALQTRALPRGIPSADDLGDAAREVADLFEGELGPVGHERLAERVLETLNRYIAPTRYAPRAAVKGRCAPHGRRLCFTCLVVPPVIEAVVTAPPESPHGYERRGFGYQCVQGDACMKYVHPGDAEFAGIAAEEQRQDAENATMRAADARGSATEGDLSAPAAWRIALDVRLAGLGASFDAFCNRACATSYAEEAPKVKTIREEKRYQGRCPWCLCVKGTGVGGRGAATPPGSVIDALAVDFLPPGRAREL